MLLKELALKYSKIEPHEVKNLISKLKIDSSYPVKRGSFGGVFRSTDMNTVYKIGRVAAGKDPSADAYLTYAKAVKHRNNPVFPQIYNIKVFELTHPEEANQIGLEVTSHHAIVNYIYIVTLEKLLPFDPTDEEVEFLWNRYFIIPLPEKDSQERRSSQFVSYLREITNTNALDIVKDPYAKELVQTLRGLLRKFSNDLYPSNIMMRRTPYGVQPVISDPVY